MRNHSTRRSGRRIIAMAWRERRCRSSGHYTKSGSDFTPDILPAPSAHARMRVALNTEISTPIIARRLRMPCRQPCIGDGGSSALEVWHACTQAADQRRRIQIRNDSSSEARMQVVIGKWNE